LNLQAYAVMAGAVESDIAEAQAELAIAERAEHTFKQGNLSTMVEPDGHTNVSPEGDPTEGTDEAHATLRRMNAETWLEISQARLAALEKDAGSQARKRLTEQVQWEADREAKKLETRPNYAQWKAGDGVMASSRDSRSRAQSVESGIARARDKADPGRLQVARDLSKAANQAAKDAKTAGKLAKDAAKFGTKEEADAAATRARAAADRADTAALRAEWGLAEALDPQGGSSASGEELFDCSKDPAEVCAALIIMSCPAGSKMECRFQSPFVEETKEGVRGSGMAEGPGDSQGSTADANATTTDQTGSSQTKGTPEATSATPDDSKTGQPERTPEMPVESDPGLKDEVVALHTKHVLERLVRGIRRIDKEIAAIEDRIRPMTDKLRRHKPLDYGANKAFERASLERAILLDARRDLVKLAKGTLSLQAKALKLRGEPRGKSLEMMVLLGDVGEETTKSALAAVAEVRKGRPEVGPTFSPGDKDAAENLILLARMWPPEGSQPSSVALAAEIQSARRAIWDLGFNPDSTGAIDVAEAITHKRLTSETQAAWDAAEEGTSFWGAVGRGLRASEKFMFEVPVTALQGAYSGLIGAEIKLLESIGLNPTPLSSDAFFRTSEIQFQESLNAVKDTGRLIGNVGTDLVQDRIGLGTLGTASLVPTADEQMVGEDWFLGAARTTSHFVGPTIVVAGSVALGGGGSRPAVSDHGVEVGVSAAERVGKFFGIYRNAADPARQATLMQRFIAKGYAPDVAEALSKPYSGMGEHFLPRWVLRRVGIPERALDSPFTVLKPRGISYGEMFELHYGVDPHFYGAAYGPGSQFAWRGSMVGAERLGTLGRAWYGTPLALKATGAAAGASYGIYKATQSPPDSEAPR
jgi:hypothetical protein